MTFPCVETADFDVVGGELTTRDRTAFRLVAYVTITDTERDPLTNATTTYFDTTLSWANSTGAAQRCMVLWTIGTSTITVQAPHRFYNRFQAGVAVGSVPALVTVSEHGGGVEMGIVPSSSNQRFHIWTDREPQKTLPHITGDTGIGVPAGSTVNARLAAFSVVDFFSAGPWDAAYSDEWENWSTVDQSSISIFAWQPQP